MAPASRPVHSCQACAASATSSPPGAGFGRRGELVEDLELLEDLELVELDGARRSVRATLIAVESSPKTP
jgi:hypothetical protein